MPLGGSAGTSGFVSPHVAKMYHRAGRNTQRAAPLMTESQTHLTPNLKKKKKFL